MRFPALFVSGLVLALPALAADDFPKLKPGQWEVTTTSNRNGSATPAKMTLCTDEATQKQMMDMGRGMGKEMCSKFDMRRDGNKFFGDTVCQMGQTKMTSHSVMTLSGDTSYKTVVNATFDPPMAGVRESMTTVEGKNVGPCRDGMTPGDVMTPTGQKFNMTQMQNLARPPAMPPAKAK